MENKTDKPYSLQDAKEITVKKMHYHDWKSYMKDNPTWYDLQEVADKAAELYKEKATEELRKENERLNAWSEKQNKFIDLLAIEIERLKESNKELVEGLIGLVNEITQPGYPLHSGMTIVWLDKCRSAIQKSEGDVNKKI